MELNALDIARRIADMEPLDLPTIQALFALGWAEPSSEYGGLHAVAFAVVDGSELDDALLVAYSE